MFEVQKTNLSLPNRRRHKKENRVHRIILFLYLRCFISLCFLSPLNSTLPRKQQQKRSLNQNTYLAVTTDGEFHKVIHKSLQGHVIREDGLSGLGNASVGARGVRGGRVEFGEQETRLGATGIADDETREGEAILDEFLSYMLA